MRYRFALLFSMLLCSCSANQRINDSLGLLPSDFSLDVTVATVEQHTLAHMRSSRFVLFPDGSIHYGDEPGWGPNTLPRRARRLSLDQMATIWGRLDQLGMSSPKNADPVVNFQLLEEPSSGSVYMIAIHADGDYWNFVRYIDSDQSIDPAFQNLIRLLGNYAWATDEVITKNYDAPIRYDLGGNPYNRYTEMGE